MVQQTVLSNDYEKDIFRFVKHISPFFQTEVNFGKDIADNSWHFVVFTVDAVDNNQVQFYLDGDPVNGGPWSVFKTELVLFSI